MTNSGGFTVTIEGLRWRSSESALKTLESVVPDVTINLRHGEFVAIIGPSGIGKSTLLKAIATWHDDLTLGVRKVFDRETSSSVALDDIFYLPQMCEHLIFPWYSVEHNLRISAQSRSHYSHQELILVVSQMAESLGFNLNTDLKKRPHQLSGGMRKRLAVAMALLTNPKILILDEPFVGLNPGLRSGIMQVIRDFIGQPGANKAALFTSHDIGEVRELAQVVLGFRSQEKSVEIIGPIEKNQKTSNVDEWRNSVGNIFYGL